MAWDHPHRDHHLHYSSVIILTTFSTFAIFATLTIIGTLTIPTNIAVIIGCTFIAKRASISAVATNTLPERMALCLNGAKKDTTTVIDGGFAITAK
jgi:hypothetical protein